MRSLRYRVPSETSLGGGFYEPKAIPHRNGKGSTAVSSATRSIYDCRSAAVLPPAVETLDKRSEDELE